MKSAKSPVSFQDVADCFSEVEWKLLQKWQNELYKNLMKEFHQVLTLMGPVIASSVFSLRAKQDDVYTGDTQRIVATQTRPSSNHSATGPVDASSVFSLRAKDYEDVCIEDTEQIEDVEQRPSTTLLASHETSKIMLSANLKEEEGACPRGPKETQNMICPPAFLTEFPSSKSEVQCMGQTDVEIRLGSTSDKPGITYTTQLNVSNIKDEGAACYMDPEEIDMKESIADPSIARMFQQSDVRRSNTVFHAAKANQDENTADLISARVFQQSDVQSNNTILQAAQVNPRETTTHQPETVSRNDSRSQSYFESEKNASHRFGLEQQQQMDRCIRLFPCKHCGKSFTQETSLHQHQKSHATKPFRCIQCGRTFTLRGNLNKHEKIHTIGRPFQCAHCEKSFNVKSSLERHLMIHSRVKPFVCTECEKGFIRKSALLQHMKTAHETQVFVLQ